MSHRTEPELEKVKYRGAFFAKLKKKGERLAKKNALDRNVGANHAI